MTEPIKIADTEGEFLVETPTNSSNIAVVFLPGISGDVFSKRFQSLVDACLNAGFTVARVNAWKNGQDVENKNLSDIFRTLGNVTTYLHEKGYTQIFGVGKSFGGGIILAFPSVYMSKQVLWAPAIGVTESGSNIEAYMTAHLGSLQSTLDLQLDRQLLRQKETPVLVIHGTADENIPFSNSEKIVSMLPNAKLVPIKGADHSYKNKQHENAVIDATMDFLINDSL